MRHDQFLKPRARKISLRLDARLGKVILTVPRRMSAKRALIFAEQNRAWIEKRLNSLSDPMPLPDGEDEKTLRRRARMVITELAHDKAELSGKQITGISIRDQKTRWGSCTHQGRLNFSWRLILAPPDVLDYVVAHEVAHLTHMNHSRAFWALCAELCNGNYKNARKWLRDNVDQLHRYE